MRIDVSAPAGTLVSTALQRNAGQA